MKRLIALILTIALCFALVSCGGGKASGEKAIIGEWHGLGGVKVIFNEDGTGSVNGIDMTWKYDEELKCYTIASMFTLTTSIKMENDMECITVGMATYYRPENMDKVLEIAKNNANAEIDGYLEDREKIEIGNTYDCGDGVSVKFTGAKIAPNGNTERLYLTAEFTADENVQEERIDRNYGFAYQTNYLYDDYQTGWEKSNISWGIHDGEGTTHLKPGETVDCLGYVYGDSDGYLDGRMNRIVTCFEINGKGYYIDLTEYIKK